MNLQKYFLRFRVSVMCELCRFGIICVLGVYVCVQFDKGGIVHSIFFLQGRFLLEFYSLITLLIKNCCKNQHLVTRENTYFSKFR